MNLLECKNLQFGYGKIRLSDSFDFLLKSGEVVALLGRNGVGKSTLLKTFLGTLLPMHGSVELLGKKKWDDLEHAKNITLVRMGTLPAERVTVKELVSLGRMPYSGIFDGRNKDDELIVENTLKLFELENFKNRYVTELSDGERSRVYLAVAIAQQVKVLLLDEPNAFLDIPNSKKLFVLLKKLAVQKEMGIVVSTHSVEYAENYCDKIMVIDNFKVQLAKAKEARNLGLLQWTEI